MRIIKKFRIRMIIGSILGIALLLVVTIFVFINQPSFGRTPRGERLERIKQSPNYRNGEFQNLHETTLMTSDRGRFAGILEFLFRKIEGLRPDQPVNAIKTDLRQVGRDKEMLVWFGHSSYLIQTGGKRILVDPVFCMASPVSFVNKPFKGTDIYKLEDMPDIDYLIISHDHWDHLDYNILNIGDSTKNRLWNLIGTKIQVSKLVSRSTVCPPVTFPGAVFLPISRYGLLFYCKLLHRIFISVEMEDMILIMRK